ncbi:MAG: hypothetical protein QF410_13320 [Planctomycetota bacterium]|jgi:hypothetical protein|nr:hypothetical protein [Planctomycetota bacterium]MDP6739985.1 hypothetical protein [Planctomycetota bacterium]MDP6940280.1 hypothetical protein [Planctomycetota bacterium]
MLDRVPTPAALCGALLLGGCTDAEVREVTKVEPEGASSAPAQPHVHKFSGADVRRSRSLVSESVLVGYVTVQLWLDRGHATPGGHVHTALKLEHDDRGATKVRGWIGGKDRSLSEVTEAEFDAQAGEYLLHLTTPDPVPAMPVVWLEIEGPEGGKHTGGAWPLLR